MEEESLVGGWISGIERVDEVATSGDSSKPLHRRSGAVVGNDVDVTVEMRKAEC